MKNLTMFLTVILIVLTIESVNADSTAEFEGCDNCEIWVTLPEPFCYSFDPKDMGGWDHIINITGSHHGMIIHTFTTGICSPPGSFFLQIEGAGYTKDTIMMFPIGVRWRKQNQ